jgi:hypothetical protein
MRILNWCHQRHLTQVGPLHLRGRNWLMLVEMLGRIIQLKWHLEIQILRIIRTVGKLIWHFSTKEITRLTKSRFLSKDSLLKELLIRSFKMTSSSSDWSSQKAMSKSTTGSSISMGHTKLKIKTNWTFKATYHLWNNNQTLSFRMLYRRRKELQLRVGRRWLSAIYLLIWSTDLKRRRQMDGIEILITLL